MLMPFNALNLKALVKPVACISMALLLGSCDGEVDQDTPLTNKDFTTISFSHELDKAGDKKITAEHKSTSTRLSVKKEKTRYFLKAKKKQALLGRKKFTAIPVKDSLSFKKYANVNLLEHLLQNESMIALKSKFINVKSGGKTVCFFFQEDFDKKLIEHSSAREGVLFVCNNQVKIKYIPKGRFERSVSASINNRITKWNQGEISTKRVFDLEKTIKFIAIYEAFNIKGLSVAYYVNPVSNLIEPFAYIGNNNKDKLYKNLLNDAVIISELTKFSKTTFDIADKIKDHRLAKFLQVGNWDHLNLVESHQSDFTQKSKSIAKYFNDSNDVYTLKETSTVINENIVFHEGAKLLLKPGESIDLLNGASIISYETIALKGDKDKPIKVYSSDGKGQGIHVINAKSSSVMQYVLFENLCALQKADWTLPSAVTFYESPVSVHNCTFSKAKSEDALNLFRSEFSISGSKFTTVDSDALDIDFCTGMISDCEFINIYNDGVDASGSEIEVSNCKFRKIGDKAISAGEKSIIKTSSIQLNEVALAFSAKDKSIIEIKNGIVDDVDVLYVVFKKKSEYGPAKIKAENVVSRNCKELQLVQQGSSLVVNGEKIHMYTNDVKKYLYGIEYGRKTVR